MPDSRFDSRPGGSHTGFGSRPGLTVSRFDSRPGLRSNETLFPGKSPSKACVRLVLLGVACAGVAGAFAASLDFRTWLRVDRVSAPWAAAISGGAATLLFVCAAWLWSTRLRWVAVSADGLRWRRGPRAKHRPWTEYIGVHRGSIEITVWGEELKAGQYADVGFRKGGSLRISTQTVLGYEELIAQIQTTASEAIRTLFPVSGSRSGLSDPDVVAYGPLRLHPHGLEWDGGYHRWDDIADYEVAAGYLRIKPTSGPEFLRRLTDLGDWGPVLARLESNVGFRLASPVDAACSPQPQAAKA
jgi:hypothetical protein